MRVQILSGCQAAYVRDLLKKRLTELELAEQAKEISAYDLSRIQYELEDLRHILIKVGGAQ